MTTTATHTRVAFQFDGELDDVPLDAAAAMADLARALLQHGDGHRGRSATMRMARLGPLLNLWLLDPECSPDCLSGSGHLPSTTHEREAVPGDTRLALDRGPDGGLRLHWARVLVEEPARPPRPRRSDATQTRATQAPTHPKNHPEEHREQGARR